MTLSLFIFCNLFGILAVWYLLRVSYRDRVESMKEQREETNREIRSLKLENAKLRANTATIHEVPAEETPDGIAIREEVPRRVSRFDSGGPRRGPRVSFGQAKRVLENQPAPQRSVNV